MSKLAAELYTRENIGSSYDFLCVKLRFFKYFAKYFARTLRTRIREGGRFFFSFGPTAATACPSMSSLHRATSILGMEFCSMARVGSGCSAGRQCADSLILESEYFASHSEPLLYALPL